ncbi:MAG: glycosyl hydrolase, partial [Phyllobacteriaceae bacterium]|nr:glycosyl hydrolase [Phyllobacteriaceae bacterium]
MILRTLYLVLAVATGFVAPAAAQPLADLDAEVERVLAGMSPAEKAAQLSVVSDYPGFDFAQIEERRYGNVMNFGYSDGDTAKLAAAYARSGETVPLLNGIDMEYGFRTLFPVPIAQAASFDLELNRRAARLMAEDARLAGVDWTMGPMADLSRDQRWGRTVEGAGEDVLLVSCMVGARTLGTRDGGQIAAVKHFLAHGFAEGAREYGPVELGEPFLRDVVLPPFRTAIALGADVVMAAFNAVNGVPMAANRHLLQDVLRGELGFSGPIVSDWEAVKQLRNHRLTDDPVETVAIALRAGIDLDMSSDQYRLHLAEAVRRGSVRPEEVDAAVRRVLRLKLGAARLHPPVPPDEIPVRRAAVDRDVDAVAVEMARRSDVLLENAGAAIPLRGVRRLAIVGALADDATAHLGPTPGHARAADVTTLRRALTERAARSGVATDYVAACPSSCADAGPGDARIAMAAEWAAKADAIVVVVGEAETAIGEATTRADLRLASGQVELVRALVATGRPVVVLLFGGRAQIVEDVRDGVAALMMVWFPGSRGAVAAAEILFGDVAPSGRLPFTWPRATGQEPLAYDAPPTSRPASPTDRWTNRDLDLPPEPRWPFGFGLTTVPIDYGAPTLDRSEATARGRVEIRVPVTNRGARRVREVVQVYARDLVASRARPDRRLVAFE